MTKEKEHYTLALPFNVEGNDRVQRALEMAPYRLQHASDAFDLLRCIIASDMLPKEDTRLASLCELLSFGFERLAASEGDELEVFAGKLCDAKDTLQFLSEKEKAQ